MTAVRNGGYDFGFATDGDADRIGAVDEKAILSIRTRFLSSF
jgi:phosphomannomutase